MPGPAPRRCDRRRVPLDADGDFDDLASLRVTSEPMVVAMAERNRLARLAEVRAEEVAAEPLVWFARHWSPGTWDTIITSVFLSHGYSPKVVAEEVSQEGRGLLRVGTEAVGSASGPRAAGAARGRSRRHRRV